MGIVEAHISITEGIEEGGVQKSYLVALLEAAVVIQCREVLSPTVTQRVSSKASPESC